MRLERVTEHYGTGIRRIKELCDEAGVGVEYRRTSDGALLVFHRRDAFDGVVHEGVVERVGSRKAGSWKVIRGGSHGQH